MGTIICGTNEAYLTIGYVRIFQRRHDEAVAAGEKAITLSPSSVSAFHMAGMYHGYAGNFPKAALYDEQARLSPIGLDVSMVDEARARFHLGDFTAARDTALRVLTAKPRWLTAHSVLVPALWNLGERGQGARYRKGIASSAKAQSLTEQDRWKLYGIGLLSRAPSLNVR